jgi:nucleoside-diphosphate-sugar epimerase
VWGLFHGSKKEGDLSTAGNVVDVRDVAYAHILALTTASAGNNRFAISIGKFTWQDIADEVHASDAVTTEWKKQVPFGKPGSGKDVVANELRGDKATKELGLKYHNLKQMYAQCHLPPVTRRPIGFQC